MSGGGLEGVWRVPGLSPRTYGVRKYSGGESNSPVLKWHLKGLTDNSRLDVFSASASLWGENRILQW
eukprot:2307216-Pyramimonas_sp.AAC.1